LSDVSLLLFILGLRQPFVSFQRVWLQRDLNGRILDLSKNNTIVTTDYTALLTEGRVFKTSLKQAELQSGA